MSGGRRDHRVLDRGHRSGLDVEHPTFFAADDRGTWREVWEDHAGGDPPAVDWADEWAGLLRVGTRPTGGYGVRVVEVVDGGDGPVVRYREEEPGAEEIVVQTLTDPWVAVAVDREVHPPEGVELERIDGDG